MDLINFGVGLASVVLIVLLVIRGVTRRSDLLLTVADIAIELGNQVEIAANNQWNRETRDMPWTARFDHKTSRVLRVLDWLSYRLHRLGWWFEDTALGEYAYGGIRTYGAPYYAQPAASNVRDVDYYDDGYGLSGPRDFDDEDDFYYGDDARYDG